MSPVHPVSCCDQPWVWVFLRPIFDFFPFCLRHRGSALLLPRNLHKQYPTRNRENTQGAFGFAAGLVSVTWASWCSGFRRRQLCHSTGAIVRGLHTPTFADSDAEHRNNFLLSLTGRFFFSFFLVITLCVPRRIGKTFATLLLYLRAYGSNGNYERKAVCVSHLPARLRKAGAPDKTHSHAHRREAARVHLWHLSKALFSLGRTHPASEDPHEPGAS